MDATRILPYQYTSVNSSSAVTVINASGNSERYRHLASLLITTTGTAATTLTLSDGTKTVAVINYPDAAAVPGSPFIWQPSDLIAQSAPNAAWTITPSANTNTYNVTVQYVEN